MPVDELLTVVQAASVLGIRPWTLRHWISDRKIDVVKYGNGSVRIKRSVLDRFVASCTIKARGGDGHTRTKQPRLLDGAGVGHQDEPLAR
jgi:excisionase family DNA binding protein